MALDENICKLQEIFSSTELELKSIEVIKDIPLELDVGNLLVSDNNEVDKSKFSDLKEVEEYFRSLARDGAQAIINAVWDLPTETIDNNIYATIPKPTTSVPREKPVPKPKPLTKWEEFKKEKGIKKKKKGTKVWDDILKEWVPRFGYLKTAAERKKNWMVEVPDSANPYEDQFQKMSDQKKERIARNEYLRLKNLARAKNVKVPSMGVTSTNLKTKSEMKSALEQTRVSTASLGRFQKTLPKEQVLPEKKRGQKRKLPSSDNTREGVKREKKNSLKMLDKMKKGELDYESAVNKQIKIDNVEMSHKDKKGKSGRRSKKGGRQRGKSEYKALAKGINKTTQKKSKNPKSKVAGGRLVQKKGNKMSGSGGKRKGKKH